jgi:hypothetical protein
VGDSANVRSEAIAEFETALGRFASASLERAEAAEAALRRTAVQLEDRRNALRRELSRLQEELDNADEEDDTSHARQQYEEAEEAISSVIRWQRNVEASAAYYLREWTRFQDLATGVTAEARTDLRRVLDNLRAYFALQHNWAGIGRGSVDVDVGDAARSARIRTLASLLISMPPLRRSEWDNLATQSARLEALQDAESGIASLVGRPALPVLPAPLDAGEFGLCDGDSIWVNEDYLEPGFNRQMIKTIVHEGRHAYQYHACNNPAFHGDAAEVEVWRWNFNHYIKWKDNPAKYISQPVEADAFAYENSVLEIFLNERGN